MKKKIILQLYVLGFMLYYWEYKWNHSSGIAEEEKKILLVQENNPPISQLTSRFAMSFMLCKNIKMVKQSFYAL